MSSQQFDQECATVMEQVAYRLVKTRQCVNDRLPDEGTSKQLRNYLYSYPLAAAQTMYKIVHEPNQMFTRIAPQVSRLTAEQLFRVIGTCHFCTEMRDLLNSGRLNGGFSCLLTAAYLWMSYQISDGRFNRDCLVRWNALSPEQQEESIWSDFNSDIVRIVQCDPEDEQPLVQWATLSMIAAAARQQLLSDGFDGVTWDEHCERRLAHIETYVALNDPPK